MAEFHISILKPSHGQAFIGDPLPAVEFQGELVSLPPELVAVPLFYRWYSSLNTRVGRGCYSLNQHALTSAGTVFRESLALGSHVVAFAASDRSGEADADFRGVRHAACAGGDKNPGQCIIHVLRAVILDLPASVSRTTLELKAEAPWLWGEESYHGYNQLAYRWLLAPYGQPSGRPTLRFAPLRNELRFLPATANQPALVSYSPALPQDATGDYDITLFVEDRLNPVPGRQASMARRVTLLP